MKIYEFSLHFPDEKSCRLHFKKSREKEGIVCKKCQGTKHYWLKTKWQWQCSKCRFRTTLRSGTIMESTQLSFHKWYLCIALMSSTKKGISALEMQRQLGHKRYRTIWTLMHRVRSSMGKRELNYVLDGIIQLDEGYFENSNSKSNVPKKGRGSQAHVPVSVMVETDMNSIKLGFVKMKCLTSHKAKEIGFEAFRRISDESIIITDQNNSYTYFKEIFQAHITYKSSKLTTKTTLKWVHIMIQNARQNISGVYNRVSGDYLQNYLDEFCYRLNRRRYGERLFDRLVIALIGN